VTFKDLKKRVVSETAQQQKQGYLKGYKINPFGFGMLKNTNSRISERMETAALITLLDYLRRMEMINHFMIISK
jgi:hypothetical protein